MRRIIIFASIMLATVCAQAQLKVNNSGNVFINSTTNSGNLNIGKSGGQTALFATSGQSPIVVRRSGQCYSPTIMPAVDADNEPYSYFYCIGVKGRTLSGTPLNDGRAFGVMGEAGNTTSGYNYGVFGLLSGSQNGAGVYGTAQSDNGININGRYAGYFNGDVKVTGTLYAPVLTTTAASANNTTAQIALAEANTVSASTVSDKLSQLSAIQYNMAMPAALANTKATRTSFNLLKDTLDAIKADTMEVAYPSDIELQALEKNHYGLMAAQLQQIYPDLVYENQQGDLCINYIEMIPLLVESIKELKAEITTLQRGNTGGGAVVMTRAAYSDTDIEESTAITIPMLKQNNPNPFTENTVIEYTLPESIQNANIYIYDMNGKQIEQIVLTERGDASITVNGGQLSAGMYLYSLIADGKIIDTKRMILTK